jgi:putative tricarboxylic transport membrane protein
LRFTFDWQGLYDGVAFIPMMLGLFAISEVLFIIETGAKSRLQKGAKFSTERAKLSEIAELWKCLIRSSAIGTAVGIIPGAGASIGSILSYNEARRFSKHPEKFGTGYPEGVCASEAANNGSVGGALVPLLALGIPGSGATAVLIGALMLHNINPGPLLFMEHADVVYGIFVSLFVANFFMFFMGIAGVRFWLTVVRVSPAILAPLIFAVSVIGAYGIGASISDVYIMLAVGIIGYIMRKFKYPLLPMVIAMVLGYMVEVSFRKALLLSHGDFTIFIKRPISLGLLLFAFASIVFAVIREVRTKKKPD